MQGVRETPVQIVFGLGPSSKVLYDVHANTSNLEETGNTSRSLVASIYTSYRDFKLDIMRERERERERENARQADVRNSKSR